MPHRQDQLPPESIEPDHALPGRAKAAERSATIENHRIKFPTVVPVVRPAPIDNGQW